MAAVVSHRNCNRHSLTLHRRACRIAGNADYLSVNVRHGRNQLSGKGLCRARRFYAERVAARFIPTGAPGESRYDGFARIRPWLAGFRLLVCRRKMQRNRNVGGNPSVVPHRHRDSDRLANHRRGLRHRNVRNRGGNHQRRQTQPNRRRRIPVSGVAVQQQVGP